MLHTQGDLYRAELRRLACLAHLSCASTGMHGRRVCTHQRCSMLARIEGFLGY